MENIRWWFGNSPGMAWFASFMIVFTVVACTLIIVFGIRDIRAAPAQRLERLTNEARCHNHARLYKIQAYVIHKTNANNCDLVLPRGPIKNIIWPTWIYDEPDTSLPVPPTP